MNQTTSITIAVGVDGGRVNAPGQARGDDRGADEEGQLDDAEDADPEDLAHEQVAWMDGR